MKSIAKALFFSLAFIGGENGYSQAELHPIGVGDKVPDVALSHVINSSNHIAKLSDIKSKLVILDFWATWCHWCIAAFPKADSLQEYFGDQIQFLLVNSIENGDNEEKVQEFYKKRLVSDKKFILPSVYVDPFLSGLFPHHLIPYEVWIKDGVVVALTDQDAITRENIQMVLSDKPITFDKNKNF